MGERILVTGGAGFIGSHLCDRLIASDREVLCADNYFTGSPANLSQLLSNPRFEALRHDVIVPLHTEADQIFNLACPASPVHYSRHPVQTVRTCVQGAINVLELARHTGATILQASTSEVYGDPERHPQTEDYWGHVNPVGARSCYDEGKRCAEALFASYRQQHRMPVKIARLFNTYGPRMQPDDGRVVSNFVVQALRGLPLTIYGDGSQTRSFCYVDDTVDGLLRLMDSPGDCTGPINLGNPQEITILELAQKVLTLVGGPSRIEHAKLPGDDPRRRRPGIALAAERLGWAPRVALDDGLRETIAWFRHRLASGPN